VVTRSVHRECSQQLRELTLKSAGLLEELGHRVEHVEEHPVPASFSDDFVLYWGFLALAQVRTGRRLFGKTFDRTRLDALTLGLERHTSRNLHRLPAVIMRLRRMRRRSAQFYRTYDAVLTPTVADATPRIGYLAPTDYQQLMTRLIDWVAFTPWQNVTGDPAISLPLAQTANGMPVGMMLAADMGQEALLLELAYELEEARPWARIQPAEGAA
jgi:amidase